MQDRPTSHELATGLRRLIVQDLAPSCPASLGPTIAACLSQVNRLESGAETEEAAKALKTALDELGPSVPRELRFQVRVGSGVAALIEREAAAGGTPDLAEGVRLAAILGRSTPSDAKGVRAMQTELAAALRDGRLDGRLGEISEAIREGLLDRLAISRPGWTEVTDDGRS